MELYNVMDLPLSNDPVKKSIQEKIINGMSITPFQVIQLGRDIVVKNINGIELKKDHAYRAIDLDTYNLYMNLGYIVGFGEEDEYLEYEIDGKIYNNNKGVDWYLGGACLKYGDIIIEVPAYKEYFTLTQDNGCGMALDPYVRHLKSSGAKKPIPVNLISNIYDKKGLISQINKNNGYIKK